MKNQPYRHIVRLEGGAELHTRKGWRGPSRPPGTNRRRKLTTFGQRFAPLSRASRAKVQPTLWGRFKAAAVKWVDEVRGARLAEAARVAYEATQKAEAEKVVAKMTHA
jgi:hypothetical protein